MSEMGITKTSTADFNQWLHAMRMVVRLPGEVPPEFRKKLWVALAERYLHIKRMNWEREAVRCLSEKWKSDDEELADQIIKDLHRTGSSFCSGTINQAKLKRVLVGYARWNKEVGYCQGFNMLGALILQVVDTDEAAAIKIMIYLVEGVLPAGYFSGALTGLQADMGVFRELLAIRLPRLSKHLQKLQGLTSEGLEPPLINVFTMQWFLTLFCTCLPFNCVLRVWDLILTDGGDILLRTALALWELLEARILATRTADDFYCTMGLLSGDLLNGSLIDANELVQRVVAMGQIHGLHKMRDKHLHNIAQWKDKRKLRLFYSDDDAESDDDSKVAMATIWGLRLSRRGSTSGGSKTNTPAPATAPSDREKIALDINLLKQQYGKLRQRQKQAQIILTAACARQTNHVTAAATSSTFSASSPSLTLNSLLAGRSAITSNKGRRPGPPLGAIPPARTVPGKTKSTTVKPPKLPPETLLWKDTDTTVRMRRNSLKWKDIPQENKLHGGDGDDLAATSTAAPQETLPAAAAAKSRAKFAARHRSESSSYSEDSDSSSSTSLCDDDNLNVVKDSGSSIESSPFKKSSPSGHTGIKEDEEVPIAEKITDIKNCIESFTTERQEANAEDVLPLPSSTGFVTADVVDGANGEEPNITSTSQLSPVADFSHYLNVSSISPLKTPSSPFDLSEMLTTLSPSPDNHSSAVAEETLDESLSLALDEGVTNTYFQRIHSGERPSNLDLTESDETQTGERNSTLSMPTYEIIDVDEMEQDGTQLGRSTSLNVLQNASGARLKFGATETGGGGGGETRTTTKERSLRGKSVSLEDTKRPVLKKSLPVSCSETMEVRRSEKALEIIQENSKILHRILRKNTGGAVAKEEPEPIIESNDIVEEVPPSSSSQTSSPAKTDETQEQQQPTTATTTNKLEALMESLPRRKTASVSDTLSSIENTIKSINSLCQEREMFGKTTRSRLMESIEEIINSGNSIKVKIDSSDDINRKLNPSRSPSLSPIREDALLSGGGVGDDADDIGGTNGRLESPANNLTSHYRPWSRSSYDDYVFRGPESKTRLDKSPSSPVITRSYLESLKAADHERVVKSAECSPSRSLARTIANATESEFDLVGGESEGRKTETKGLLDKYLSCDGAFLIKDSPMQGPSKGLFDFGIEPRKHKSLEFDAI